MSARPLGETLVCDTTAIRYFTLIDQIEVLSRVMNGTIRVPREVFDPDDDSRHFSEDLLSEIGQTELYWARKRSPEAGGIWSKFKALRHRTDIEVVDLEPREMTISAEVTGRRYLRRFGKSGRLGKGEGSVIALAEIRGWVPVMDDRAGRQVLEARSPGRTCLTTDSLLRQAAFAQIISSPRAAELYQDMVAAGYRGPPTLWLVEPN